MRQVAQQAETQTPVQVTSKLQVLLGITAVMSGNTKALGELLLSKFSGVVVLDPKVKSALVPVATPEINHVNVGVGVGEIGVITREGKLKFDNKAYAITV